MQRNPTLLSIVLGEAGADAKEVQLLLQGSPIHSIRHGICVHCETVHDGGSQLCVAVTANTSLKQISYVLVLMQVETVRCVCSPTDERRITCSKVYNMAEAAPSSCQLLARTANCYAMHNSQPSVVL